MSLTLINPYRLTPPGINWQPIAAGLLADLSHYWDLNGDLVDQHGIEDMSPDVGGPTYQAGVNGQEMKPNSQTGADLPSALATNYSFGFFIKPIGTSGTNRVLVGLASDMLDASHGRNFVSIYSAGLELRAYLVGTGAGTPVPFAITPSELYFCRVNVDFVAETMDFYVNEDYIGSWTTDVIWTDMAHFVIRANAGFDQASPDWVSKAWLIRRLTTTDEGAYLMLNKLYADIVADAVP